MLGVRCQATKGSKPPGDGRPERGCGVGHGKNSKDKVLVMDVGGMRVVVQDCRGVLVLGCVWGCVWGLVGSVAIETSPEVRHIQGFVYRGNVLKSFALQTIDYSVCGADVAGRGRNCLHTRTMHTSEHILQHTVLPHPRADGNNNRVFME